MKPYFDKIIDDIVTKHENGTTNASNYKVKLKYYPEFLYKYRDCKNNYNFEMIEQEYLWADIPERFIDPTDSLVHLKMEKELALIKKWYLQHSGELLYYSIPPKGMRKSKHGQTLKKYIETQSKFVDENGKFSAKNTKKLLCVEIKKMPEKSRSQFYKTIDLFQTAECEGELERKIKGVLSKLSTVVNAFRKHMKVCCLTQCKDNQKMWEEYADGYTGFVIEYNISKAEHNTDVASVIAKTFPVQYYQRMPKVPLLPFIQKSYKKELYGKDISVHDAIKKLYKQIFVKKKEYSVEQEWRIVAETSKISFPIISAVYMGYRISEENAERLKKICCDKHIALYQQRFHPYTRKMLFDLIDCDK